MRILLARHPETESNLERRYVGRGGTPYTPLGERQRGALAGSIASFGPDAILSSPAGRAARVARDAAARLGLTPHVDPDLAEIDFGRAEGLTYEEAYSAGVPMNYLGGPASDGEMFGGGERWAEFGARLSRVTEVIRGAGENVAVVTHGGVIRWLHVRWLGLPDEAAWRLAIPPASIAVLGLQEGHDVLEHFGLRPGLTPWETGEVRGL